MDSISGITNTVIALQQNKSGQAINTAVLSKAQEVQNQQGDAALKLIESVPDSSSGGIDVYV